MKYIAYGSNMVSQQMAFRCPNATLLGTGHLDFARLEFYYHATVERSNQASDRVPVPVWEISNRDEQSLDRYEGYPKYYTKEMWPVHMDDGSEIQGMIYLMALKRSFPPEVYYYHAIADAYRELGLSGQIETVLKPALNRAQQRAQMR